jgi:CHAD domain-containing protein
MRLEDRALDLSAEEGAHVVARGLLAEARAAADGLAAGTGDEPLHDFRVALRRLRSALRTFRPWLQGSVRRRHERKTKRIARSTNEARDTEVQLAWLATKRHAFGARRRVGYDLMVSRFEASARRAPPPARVARRFRRAAEKLERRLESSGREVAPRGEGGGRFAAVLASLIEAQTDALSDAMAAIRDASDSAGIHRTRIEGKRLRYLLEPLRGHRGADARTAIGLLKRLQDVLGELHDAQVLADELRAALVDAAAERARLLHAEVYAHAATATAIRGELRANPRPGLLALVRLVREQRDATLAELEGEWRGAGMGALVAKARDVAEALRARDRARPVLLGGRRRTAP